MIGMLEIERAVEKFGSAVLSATFAGSNIVWLR